MSKQYTKKLEFWAFSQNTGRISMKAKTVANSLKNAVSTVFLLAGAFFVCSTFLSMRAVFADPIAPVIDPTLVGPQAQRAGSNARTSGRASPRDRQATNRKTVARTAVTNTARNQATQSRGVATRGTASRSAVQNPRANTITSRNVNTASRNVVSRQNTTANRASNAATRTVRARNTTTRNASDNARVSLQGSAIRGSKTNVSSSYSYLSSKLYTGNYSNIIDSTTGLISAEAFDNCMTSYYTCMDEICTARNQAQRRCGCAGRVTAFAEAETALERANEELIQASGELALLIANKGKDVSDAFQLTEAEQVMNCVSWKEMSEKVRNGITDENKNEINDDTEWCQAHGIYDSSKCSKDKKPSYCESNDFGFNVDDLNGTGSDILSNLKSWADAKDKTITILTDDENSLLTNFENVSGIVSGMAGLNANSTETTDSLSQKWGYELFKHAHNEVCSRVLDSCFNGIYEACGTPPSGGKCATSQTSNCPYNYNSKITLTNNNEINLLERSNSGSINSSAACFGYTTTSVSGTTTDPYVNLRGPVADARRSIMNKYLLDANADCDLYGEQLRTAAQNIALQKAAAQQALQQKRLEFAVEERDSILTAANEAITNFNECISEIYDCYESTADSEPNWPDARIKTYCAQISNVPHCYEEMICNPSTAQFRAVIDASDNSQCINSQDYTKNTCRNVVTLNEILKGTGKPATGVDFLDQGDSAAMREQCLQSKVDGIRNWTSYIKQGIRCSYQDLVDANATDGNYYDDAGKICIPSACKAGFKLTKEGLNITCEQSELACSEDKVPNKEGTQCVDKYISCSLANTIKAYKEYDVSTDTYGKCVAKTCDTSYHLEADKCVSDTKACDASELPEGASAGEKIWSLASREWGICKATECTDSSIQPTLGACVKLDETPDNPDFPVNPDGPTVTFCLENEHLEGDICVSNTQDCTEEKISLLGVTKAEKTWDTKFGKWGLCIITGCKEGFSLVNGGCQISTNSIPAVPGEK